MSERVRLDVEDRVATLTLDDPERRNALSLELVDELVSAVDRLETDPDVGALVVTGAPPAFCAGADLGHLGGSRSDGLRRVYDGFLRVAGSTLPTVAAVNGAAVGAGMNLALACDIRLAARRARFDTRFLQLGLHPGGGHTWMFRRVAGLQATMAAVVFGEVLDGTEAERVGLVYRCVDDDQLLDVAQSFAAGAAAAPRQLAILAKQTIADMATIESHADAVARELEPQLWTVQQPWFEQRIAALHAKISSKPS